MSEMRVRLEYDGIDEREEIDALERSLKAVQSVKLHEIGLNQADISYETNDVEPEAFERIVAEAGGTLRRTLRLD